MTAQLRLRREPSTTPAPGTHHFELDRWWDPEWDTDPELSQFASLPPEERVRVIIRVLCGLVALEERAPAPVSTRLARRPTTTSERPRRRLPFLGYERPAVVLPELDDEPGIVLTWPMSEGRRVPVGADA